MGCDIHCFAEKKKDNKWVKVEDKIFPSYGESNRTSEPFGERSYSVFAFLAGVRNYDCCEPISEPKGLPEDSEYLNSEYEKDGYGFSYGSIKEELQADWNYHTFSYLTLKELLDFDYDKTFWNRRVTKGSNGAALAEEGEGIIISYRDNLGKWFFEKIEILKTLGNPEDVRIVFWFDN